MPKPVYENQSGQIHAQKLTPKVMTGLATAVDRSSQPLPGLDKRCGDIREVIGAPGWVDEMWPVHIQVNGLNKHKVYMPHGPFFAATVGCVSSQMVSIRKPESRKIISYYRLAVVACLSVCWSSLPLSTSRAFYNTAGPRSTDALLA